MHGDDHEHPVILVGNKSDGSTNHTDKVGVRLLKGEERGGSLSDISASISYIILPFDRCYR